VGEAYGSSCLTNRIGTHLREEGPHQEWHPEDSILLEQADDKSLLDYLIADSAHQLNDAVEGNRRPVRQRAMFPLTRLQATLVSIAERVKESTA